MSSSLHWWLALAIMGGLTFVLRALPLAAHKVLAQSRLAAALNRRLPLCVVAVLLLVSLRGSPAELGVWMAEWAALAVVALTYLRWRNPLLSVVAGVAALNALSVWLPAWLA